MMTGPLFFMKLTLKFNFQKEVPIKAKDEDEKFEDEEPPIEEAPRLMIAVGVPAFDRRRINITDSRRGARLLGVAATDVPVEDINKLSLPYKVCPDTGKFSGYYFDQINANIPSSLLARRKRLFIHRQQ